MLKLEKKARSKTVTVTVREQKSFLTPLLLKAFCLAVGVHLMAFLIFNIHAFKLSSYFLHPPIQVQAEIRPSPKKIWIQEKVPEDVSFLEPPLLAFLEKSPEDFEPLLAEIFFPVELRRHPFTESEKGSFNYPIRPLLIPLEIVPKQIFITGSLSNRKLVKSDPRLNQKTAQPQPFYEPHYLSYKVQIDENSGQIFWYERLSPADNRQTEELAEQLLLSLEFQKGQPFLHTSGQIDFVLY